MNTLIFITLHPKRPGAVSKIHVEVNKITAIEEITERAEVKGSRIWAGGQCFDVREKPEDITTEATRLINRALDSLILR